MGEEANKKGPDGNYSFCSLGDGKAGAGVIQPGSVSLPSPHQCLNKEPQGKEQEPPRDWYGVTSPPAPQKKDHPLQTKPSLPVTPAMTLQRGAAPQQRAPIPWRTVPWGRGQAPADSALVAAGLSQVWGDPTARCDTQHSRGLPPYNNTSTKPWARDGLQGTRTPQGDGTAQAS